MKKKILGGAVAVIVLIGMVGIANANLVVYHNQSSFLNDAGSVTVYDFESDTPGDIISHNWGNTAPLAVQDFGDFSIDATTSTGIYLAEIRQQGSNNDIYMNSYSNNAALKVIFDEDITAFGFTYVAEGDDSLDHFTVNLLGTTWDLGTPGDSGFFGVLETSGTIAAGTSFSFGQQSYYWSIWSGGSFDNLTYTSNSSAPVPEPATMLLMGTGLAGLAGLRRRRGGK